MAPTTAPPTAAKRPTTITAPKSKLVRQGQERPCAEVTLLIRKLAQLGRERNACEMRLIALLSLKTCCRHGPLAVALDLERETLGQRLRMKSSLCDDLENQLVQVLEKNTELAIQNTDLQKQVQKLQFHGEQKTATANPLNLNTSSMSESDRLDNILRQMREAAERRKDLEREHADTLAQLRDKQAEVQRQQLPVRQMTAEPAAGTSKKGYETVEALQSKIRELEKKAELQNVRHEELLLEMAAIKRTNQHGAAAPPSAPLTPTSPWKGALKGGCDLSPSESASSVGEFKRAELAALFQHNGGSTPSSTTTTHHHPTLNSTALQAAALFQAAEASARLHDESHCFAYHSACLRPLSSKHHQSPFAAPAVAPAAAAVPTRPPQQHDTEIDRIMAKIEQDNRILAELDKSRSTVQQQQQQQTSAGDMAYMMMEPPPRRHALLPPTPSRRRRHHSRVPRVTFANGAESAACRAAPYPSGVNTVEYQTAPTLGAQMMILNPQTGTLMSQTPLTAAQSHLLTGNHASGLLPQAQGLMGQPGSAGLLPNATQGLLGQTQGLLGAQLGGPASTPLSISRIMPKVPAMATLPPIFSTPQFAIDSSGLMNGSILGPAGMLTDQMMDNKMLDMLDIPGKGRCYVFMAKYSYDPFTQSPNEHPEGELFVNAGDYLLVWGNMDEDGFFDGETLDGRRGLVPSNFVHRLIGDELLEFHQMAVLGLAGGPEEPHSTSIPHGIESAEFDAVEDMQPFRQASPAGSLRAKIPDRMKSAFDLARRALSGSHGDLPLITVQAPSPDHVPSPAPPDPSDGTYVKRLGPEYSYLELQDIMEDEEEMPMGEGPDALFFSVLVPPPKQLTLERQLNKSILIGWNAPDCPPGTIDCYHVYVNGVLKTTVKASERTRALVEGVDSNRPHRISVRSVTPNRRTSRDAACTMVVGKDVPLGPTTVRASNVTSSSAVISWLPSNSNCQHSVCVNNVEVRTLKPGVYRHTITGLAPNTTYRVTVRAKAIRAPYFDEKTSNQRDERLACHIDFRTLPKAQPIALTKNSVLHAATKGTKGLPDPPVDVQVENGPQDGTMLVTWMPVAGSGAPVTGYAVYADGKKVTDIDSPTGDHALIDIAKLVGLNPRQVTVRTKSRDAQSSDSCPTSIPPHVMRGQARGHQKDNMGMRAQPEKYGRYNPHSAMPAHMVRGRGGRQQIIMDTEENLSDKEVYPPSHMNIPSIEITKDTNSENFSEDDFERRRNYGPRSHMERGRPPPPPHMSHQQRHQDDRDYYGEGRGRDPRLYRGGPGHDYRGRGAGPPLQGARRVRWFVALFDYDPTTMSPNPDACEEELPFNEGDPIKIYGEKDADGFYWGECRGRRGYVPYNMVMETNDYKGEGGAGGGGGPVSHRGRADRWGDIYANMPVKKMVALYDYDPQELSPNVDAEVELSFKTGDVIYVYGEMDDDGFFMGELDGLRGLVPSNFLAESTDLDHRQGRGPGPGARGPPPPPRGPADRRRAEGPRRGQDPRMRGGVSPRRGGNMRDMEPMATTPPQATPTTTAPPTAAPKKGLPSVVPDFVIPTKESPTTATAAPKFPEAPNFMQKFTEITGGAAAEGENLISKGKELIFKKFGLGN
ncbi:RIMS-binding protein 2 isoform X4 [Neocloeon triangulifer]|uniref:RIMS-binding protein 2 isoform X4 n=1 Tax=Neocloeon triangulifer TaxID=2078957 RepID=UPI00286ECBDD|nr:RIMS-binding protein 2 isoform X4 [Neocloeon triangulifer]